MRGWSRRRILGVRTSTRVVELQQFIHTCTVTMNGWRDARCYAKGNPYNSCSSQHAGQEAHPCACSAQSQDWCLRHIQTSMRVRAK